MNKQTKEILKEALGIYIILGIMVALGLTTLVLTIIGVFNV